MLRSHSDCWPLIFFTIASVRPSGDIARIDVSPLSVIWRKPTTENGWLRGIRRHTAITTITNKAAAPIPHTFARLTAFSAVTTLDEGTAAIVPEDASASVGEIAIEPEGSVRLARF